MQDRWYVFVEPVVRHNRSAIENGDEVIFANLGRRHGTDIRLDNLADFLFRRHAAQQFGDAFFHLWIAGNHRFESRPGVRIDATGCCKAC